MKRVFYRKLIRDLIPDKMMRKGDDFDCYRLDQRSFEKELLKKLVEESAGAVAAKNRRDLLEELADVMAVIEAIKKLKNISAAELKRAIAENNKRKGGFSRRIYLVWSDDSGYRSNEPLGRTVNKR